MLRGTQLADGRFCCVSAQSSDGVAESDIRFVYCAAVIAAVLDVWDCIDVDKMRAFLQASQSYDGCFGMWPGAEAHGGCTYCALAALSLMGSPPPRVDDVLEWCIKRETGGFHGRLEKVQGQWLKC